MDGITTELTFAVRQDSDITTVSDIAAVRDEMVDSGVDMGNCQVIVAAAAYALQAQDSATTAMAAVAFAGVVYNHPNMTDDGRRRIRRATDAVVNIQRKAEVVVGLAEEFSRELGMAMLTPLANPKSPLMQKLDNMKRLTQECADDMAAAMELLPEKEAE